ncbi:MAG: DUF1385 domain-containing protein [Candidatus Eisenbacteria bacterium]
MASEKITVGGQAVIEGVMMRSPTHVATAVRRLDGEISVRKTPFVSVSKRNKLLGIPVIRGAVVLIETLSLGIGALTFSAEEAMKDVSGGDAKGGEAHSGKAQASTSKSRGTLTTASLVLTVVAALVLGFMLFFYLPLFVAERIGVKSAFWFNVIDGAVRLVVFVLYVRLVGLWGEMKKLYQYHGAEHKTIHAFEAGEELVTENVMKHSTLHARCGTSFLLAVVVVSLVVFIALGRPEDWGERAVRFLLVPAIAGVAFELTKLSGKHAKSAWGSALIAPGLWLQRMTTAEPTAGQVEVALRALREVL